MQFAQTQYASMSQLGNTATSVAQSTSVTA
jgi:hypothetical protein